MKEKIERIGLQILKYFLIVIGFAIILSGEVSQIFSPPKHILYEKTAFPMPECRNFVNTPQHIQKTITLKAPDMLMPDIDVLNRYMSEYNSGNHIYEPAYKRTDFP